MQGNKFAVATIGSNTRRLDERCNSRDILLLL